MIKCRKRIRGIILAIEQVVIEIYWLALESEKNVKQLIFFQYSHGSRMVAERRTSLILTLKVLCLSALK